LLTISLKDDPKQGNVKDVSLMNALETIGNHLYFAPKLELIALEVLRSAVPDLFSPSKGSKEDATFPPYIAVHIRRGDFERRCRGEASTHPDKSSCFTPLSVFAEAVESVKSELILHSSSSSSSVSNLSEEEIQNLPILIFSDEPKHTTAWFMNLYHRPEGSVESWWASVDDLHWISIDHSSPAVNTEKRWGMWYTNLADMVLMSNAVGFVGTRMSTYSLMASRRVEQWRDGPVRMIMPVV
jgi:hypothetical protein